MTITQLKNSYSSNISGEKNVYINGIKMIIFSDWIIYSREISDCVCPYMSNEVAKRRKNWEKTIDGTTYLPSLAKCLRVE